MEALLGEKAGNDNGTRVGTALRSFLDELSATIVRIFAYIGAIAVIAITAWRFFGAAPVEAGIDPATRSQWANVDRPFRAFALSLPEFAEPEPDYAIRRHAGGGRKDVMTWGAPLGDAGGGGARLMLEIYRPGAEIKRFGDAASEAVARTAMLGGPYALKPGAAIDTKFGPLSTFDFTALSGERRHQCLGFVRAIAEPRMQLAGWYCRGRVEVIDRGALGCALERLSLMMSASEPKVTDFFAQAELKRKLCAAKPKPTQRVSNTKRHDWLDAPKDPKLRGRVAGK